jgi:hypothetical protein
MPEPFVSAYRPHKITAPEPPGGFPHPRHDPHHHHPHAIQEPPKQSLVGKLLTVGLTRTVVWIMGAVLAGMLIVLSAVMASH